MNEGVNKRCMNSFAFFTRVSFLVSFYPELSFLICHCGHPILLLRLQFLGKNFCCCFLVLGVFCFVLFCFVFAVQVCASLCKSVEVCGGLCMSVQVCVILWKPVQVCASFCLSVQA